MKNILFDKLNKITKVSEEYKEKARLHACSLAIPNWSLGKVLDIGVQICAIQETIKPDISKKRIYTMAGDHGVAEQGVSAFKQEVTLEMVKNIIRGGAGVNVLAKSAGADVRLVDMGVKKDFTELVQQGKLIDCKIAYGTKDFTKGSAMSEDEAVQALLRSMEIVDKAVSEEGVKIIGTGDLGIANTTASSAILSVFSGLSVSECTGRGTGIDDERLRHKVEVIQKAIEVNKPNKDNALDVLMKVGGFDIAGIAGLILGCAYNKIPVVVDGFISTAGALVAYYLCPNCVDYMIASHKSNEMAHIKMWENLGIEPILDLNFRLGEGTGAAVCMNICESAVDCMCDMLTFEEAEVTNGL